MGGKIIQRIRLTSAKDLVEVEAELGKSFKGASREIEGDSREFSVFFNGN